MIDDTIGDAFPADRFPELAPECEYRLKLRRAFEGKAKVGGKPYFKAVVEVTDARGPGATEVGKVASIFIPWDKFGYYKGDIRSWAASVLGEPIKEVSAEDVRELLADTNPGEGHEFLTAVRKGKEKNDGGFFLKYQFAAIETK